MTIERIGQITGETQYTSEWSGFAPISVAQLASITLSNTRVNSGDWSWRLASNAGGIGHGMNALSSFRIGLWFNYEDLDPGDDVWLLAVQEGGTESPKIIVTWTESIDALTLTVDGSLKDSTTAAAAGFLADTWLHLGLTVKGGASGFVSVYLNRVKVLEYTGVLASSVFDGVYFGSTNGGISWSSYCYIDDYYCDSTIGEDDEAPPYKWFVNRIVTAAGADAEFTPLSGANYQMVDDTVVDGDTTHNHSAVDGNKDTFIHSVPAVPADKQIDAIIVYATAKKLNAEGTNQMKVHTHDGLLYDSSVAKDIGMDWEHVWERFTLQPDGSEWNEVDATAMQIGYESVVA